MSKSGAAYNPLALYPKLVGWFAALTNSAAAPTSIAFISDSLGEGVGVTFLTTECVALAKALRRRLGLPAGGVGFVPVQNVGAITGWPWTAVGGAFNTTLGGAKHSAWFASAGTDVATFTVPAGSTRLDLTAIKYNAANTVRWRKNGGAYNTGISLQNASAVYGFVFAQVAVTGGDVIDVSWDTGGSNLIEGARCYAGDELAGVQVHNLGWTGATAAFFNGAGAAQWANSVAALAPALLIVQLGINDANSVVGNKTPAQFSADMVTLFGFLRGAFSAPIPPIALSFPYAPNVVLASGYKWADYLAALTLLTNADPALLLIDHSARMPAVNAAQTYGLYSDTVHCTAKGYALLAESLAAVLTPN